MQEGRGKPDPAVKKHPNRPRPTDSQALPSNPRTAHFFLHDVPRRKVKNKNGRNDGRARPHNISGTCGPHDQPTRNQNHSQNASNPSKPHQIRSDHHTPRPRGRKLQTNSQLSIIPTITKGEGGLAGTFRQPSTISERHIRRNRTIIVTRNQLPWDKAYQPTNGTPSPRHTEFWKVLNHGRIRNH